ncbi:glycosyltransferase, partial [Thermodesulfobacteriota bacterium]
MKLSKDKKRAMIDPRRNELTLRRLNTVAGPIVFYTGHLNIGGAEIVLLNLANALSQYGERVVIVLDRVEGSLLLDRLSASVEVIELDVPRLRFAFRPLFRVLNRIHPALVMTVLPPHGIMAAMVIRLVRRPIKHVVAEHTFPTQLRGRLLRAMLGLAYRYADSVVVPSAAVAADVALLAAMDQGDITILDNPLIDPQDLENAQRHAPHPWLAPDGPQTVVAAGRLVPLKGYLCLIKAVALMPPPTRLLIVGEGPCRDELAALIADLQLQDRVTLAGAVPSALPFIAHASAVVISSHYEGFGNTIIEAMACGVPVVSTECSAAPRLLLDYGRRGRLVPVDDPVAMAKALTQTLSNPHPGKENTAVAAPFGVEQAAK